MVNRRSSTVLLRGLAEALTNCKELCSCTRSPMVSLHVRILATGSHRVNDEDEYMHDRGHITLKMEISLMQSKRLSSEIPSRSRVITQLKQGTLDECG